MGLLSSNLPLLYCNSDDLQALLSAQGVLARADDDNDDTYSATELTYETQAIAYATTRVNFFCIERYDVAQLATSWMANYWTAVLACHWLSCRRGNPPPGSFDQLAKEATEDMKLVHSGLYPVPGIGEREVGFPSWSNVNVDVLYPYRKIRVERALSDRTPVKFQQPKYQPGEYIPFDL